MCNADLLKYVKNILIETYLMSKSKYIKRYAMNDVVGFISCMHNAHLEHRNEIGLNVL